MTQQVGGSEWTEIISERDSGNWYTIEAANNDARIAFDRKPHKPDAGVSLRQGDSSPVRVSESVYAIAEGNSATLSIASGRVERQARREIERPDDAAIRSGNAEIVNKTGTVGSTSGASSTVTLADNTSSGVYRLQTVNLAETSGNYSENINLQVKIKDDTGTVTETIEANLGQLPFVFGTPVRIPSSFSVDASVVNYSGVGIDFRVSAAYTKEVSQ